MMRKQVPPLDPGQEGGRAGLCELTRRHRPPGLAAEAPPARSREFDQSREADRRGRLVELRIADPQLAQQDVAHRRRCVGADLEPDDVAEPAPRQSRLQRLEQVVRVARHRDVRVSSEPKGAEHPGAVADEGRQEVLDRVFDGDLHAARTDLEEAGNVSRHADADEMRVIPASGRDADVEGERLDVRERGGEPDRDRRQKREDVPLPAARQRPDLARTARLRAADPDPGGFERREENVRPQCVLRRLEGDDRRPRRGERLRGRPAVRRPATDAGLRLLLELGHAHSEEFVEVRVCGTKMKR